MSRSLFFVKVARLKAKLLETHPDLFWREVDTDGVAYHAPHLDCYFDFLVAEFEKILGPSAKPLDGHWIPTSVKGIAAWGAPEASTPVVLDSHFHARNITSPVFFQQAIEALPPNTLVVEIGSSQSLLSQAKLVYFHF